MVLAHRLSANGSLSVIVLEAGPDVRDVAEINDPYAYIGLSNDGHYNWLWPTVNQTVGGARKVMQGGKALGGSTSSACDVPHA
jgi:choline dehydrogenase-like flavoprotein